MKKVWSKKALVGLLALTAIFTVTACQSAPQAPPAPETSSASAFKQGVPGGIVVNTTKVSARVTAIDYAKREVTLQVAEGEPFTVKVGPAAVNFDQVKKGDLVNLTLTEEMVVTLDDAQAPQGQGSASMVALAPKGAQPGGLMAQTHQIVGTVTSIDLMKHTATLRFEDGTTKTFQVREDVDLGKHKAGERVVFRVTEMIALSIEKP
ncbi:MAG: hypothetical protein HY911_15990 [Desulfobacterales bacterium]|nr:hypothetical protein [Desulfobacterales bacterium]